MKQLLSFAGAFLLATMAATWALADTGTTDAGGATPVVIELFTAQGCSSCPPADALLGELARRPNVVALAYHVDYWDDLGWKDRFAIPESVARQRGYVRRLSASGAFTPQAVISGDTSVVGSNRGAVERALAEPRDALAVVVSKADTNLQIDLPERWREPMDLYLVSYLSEAKTPIGRGENARRTLAEFNIVRSFTRVGRWDGTPRRMTVPLASIPPDATAVVALLQRPNQGAIAGAGRLALR